MQDVTMIAVAMIATAVLGIWAGLNMSFRFIIKYCLQNLYGTADSISMIMPLLFRGFFAYDFYRSDKGESDDCK